MLYKRWKFIHFPGILVVFFTKAMVKYFTIRSKVI